jgi:four helix bundle protein
MRSQLRRAAASISTNLAEACGRGGDRDFARFVQIALGSASETEYLLLLAKDLEYLSEKDQIDLTANVREVKKMLSGLRRKGEEYVQASRKPLMADG